MMCDGEMKLKTAAEKLACEKQIMASCWSTEGEACATCMDEHAAKHREAPRMCSEFQLANFCAFYSWGKKGAAPSVAHSTEAPPEPKSRAAMSTGGALAVNAAAGSSESTSPPTVIMALPAQPLDDPCHVEIEKQCSYHTQTTKDCMKCVKTHVKKFGHCEPSDLLAVCDLTMAGKPKDATLLCVNQVEASCYSGDNKGGSCMQCLKGHISRIDDGLIDDNYCNAFQLEHFCYFYALEPVKVFDKEDTGDVAQPQTDLEIAMERVGNADQNTFSCQLAFEQFCGDEVSKKFRCMKCLKTYEKELLLAGLHCSHGMFARFCLYGAVVESTWDKAADAAEGIKKPASLVVLNDVAGSGEDEIPISRGVTRSFRNVIPDEAGRMDQEKREARPQKEDQVESKDGAVQTASEALGLGGGGGGGSIEPAASAGSQIPLVLLCILVCACFGARTHVLGALVHAWQGPERGVKPGVWQYENEDEYGGGGYESDSGEPAGEGQFVDRHREREAATRDPMSHPIVSRLRGKSGRKTPLKV
jgi:hypothetical protein